MAQTSSPSQSTDAPKFAIRQYEPQDHEQVAKLVADGLLHYAHVGDVHYDFWVSYVQQALATDVADIQARYMTLGSNFFVVTATPSTENSAPDATSEAPPVIVGTLAVMKKSDSVAELKRVSVKGELRRFGIGRLMMAYVEQWAKTAKYEKLTLSCTGTQLQAIKFYESLGFTLTKKTVRLADPYLELTHFEKVISHSASWRRSATHVVE